MASGKIRIRFRDAKAEYETEISDNPLGRRWWTHGGMPPEDRYGGHPYGQSRCVPLEYIADAAGRTLLLCAMERDGAIVVTTAHSLFPILDASGEEGAEAFVTDALARHAVAPDLFAFAGVRLG